MVVFLGSERSSFVTGALISVEKGVESTARQVRALGRRALPNLHLVADHCDQASGPLAEGKLITADSRWRDQSKVQTFEGVGHKMKEEIPDLLAGKVRDFVGKIESG